MCDCIEEIDKMLSEKNCNSIVEVPMFGPKRAIIRTMVDTPKRGAKPVAVFATFCPFCGEQYSGVENATAPIVRAER